MRHIKLEVLTTEWCRLLRVVEQTHRNDDFTESGCNNYTASNGFELDSAEKPAISNNMNNCLYLRGTGVECDNDIITIPLKWRYNEWLSKCRFAVREYNAKFGDKDPSAVMTNIEVIE